jgi:hypothetical protein
MQSNTKRTMNFYRGNTRECHLHSSNIYIQRLVNYFWSIRDSYTPEDFHFISDKDIDDFLSEDAEGLEMNDDQMRCLFSDPAWRPDLGLWRAGAQLPDMTQEVYLFCSVLVYKFY